jgi:serine/threonine protein kinase
MTIEHSGTAPDESWDERLLDLLDRRWEETSSDRPSPVTDDDLSREAQRLAERLERVTEVLNAPLRGESPRFVALGLNLRVVRPLAKGGQGSIYLAFDETLKREVALKTAHWDDSESVLRLRKEAEIASRLNHPGIVPVFGAGVTELGLPFLVMRYVPGVTLEGLLAEAAHQSFAGDAEATARSALRSLSDACRTAAYAHDRGVLHGDLKPSNILIGRFGETALLDWGLATPFSEDSKPPDALEISEGSALRSHTIKCGTREFMSPERIAGDLRIGPWTDIYSLGAVIDRIVRGGPRDSSGDATAKLGSHPYNGPQFSGFAKSALRRLADRACDGDPGRRPSSARRVGDEIDQILKTAKLLAAARSRSLFGLFRAKSN